MSEKPSNPRLTPGDNECEFDSLTLRDLFAGLVAAGASANPVLLQALNEQARRLGMSTSEVVARDAYRQADALLAERARRD